MKVDLGKELPYVVQCKRNTFWEIMAAFDVRSVALEYARDCAAFNTQFEYRVAQMVDGESR